MSTEHLTDAEVILERKLANWRERAEKADAKVKRLLNPANDPEMKWDEELGWLHQNQLSEVTELRQRAEKAEAELERVNDEKNNWAAAASYKEQKLQAELERERKANAEMRSLLDPKDKNYPKSDKEFVERLWKALSADAGQGYYSEAELNPLVEALDRVYRNALIADGINVKHVETIWLRQTCAKALAHARELGIGKETK